MVAYSSHASTERAMIPASFIGTHQTLLYVDSDTWLMQPSNQAFIALHGFCGFGSPKTVADINNPERVLSLLRPFPSLIFYLRFGSGNFYCCCAAAAATMDGFLETSQRKDGRVFTIGHLICAGISLSTPAHHRVGERLEFCR